MNKLLNLGLWFNTRPGSLMPVVQNILIFFVLGLAVLAFIFNLLKTRKRSLYTRIWQKLFTFSLTNFIIGLFITFFTYELIPILSMRMWFLIWGLSMVIWLGFIAKVFSEIPKIKEKLNKENEYNKYIP